MSQYALYTPEQTEELLSNFLIDSWSYSKVATFSRNQKEFERTAIYRERSRRAASTVAGSAYHNALKLFFTCLQQGIEPTLIELEQCAYEYIDNIPANDFLRQKTTPTVAECVAKATAIATSLIRNFYAERELYTLCIAEVLACELRYSEWVTINGVDIPLPCVAVIDLVIRTIDGKIVIIDHKSKALYTDEKTLYYNSAKQAITYAKVYEAHCEVKADEVWFVENKYSSNKNKSPQLIAHKIVLDDNTMHIYESILYEPLRKMLEAVQDPDYIYLINDNDNLTDIAELYDFWCKTMIAEVEEFNVQSNKKEIVEKRLKKIRDATIKAINPKTIREFRKQSAVFIPYNFTSSNMTHKERIEHVLRSFNIIINVAHEISGYSSNTYLIEVGAGVKISNIAYYALDIANALNVPNVRVGKILVLYQNQSYLPIEVSKKRDRDLIFDSAKLASFKLPIGIDNFGNLVTWDIDNHSTPHALVCGATGSGKSVSIRSTIEYALLAGVADIYIFDPKFEFVSLRSDVIKVFNDIEDIEQQMCDLVKDMQQRVELSITRKTLIVFDEFADAVASAKRGAALDITKEVVVGISRNGQPKIQIKKIGQLKSLEENLKILLQKGRSSGFRILAATQRASVNVITGDAKVNFPVQICFRVPKEIDSKVVIDEAGAELLSGLGDGLIRSPQYPDIVRFQGFYYK